MTKILDIETESATKINLRFNKVRKRISKLGIPNKKISIMLDTWVQRNFKSEGGNVGGWRPIQRDGRILQDTGRLRLSYLPFSSDKDAGIGSELDYSEQHEEGIGVFKRRVLPNIEDVQSDIVDKFETHIAKSGDI